MADAQKVIELVFNGIDKTGQATQSALNNLSSFANSTKTITQPVADFTVAALKLEAGILAAGVAVVAFSINSAGQFDTAFRQISTLFDASEEDMKGFKDAILDYSKTSGKSLEDITNSISAAVGSGVKWSDSLALISTAEKLAIATRADLKSTTDVLVSTMNVYGIKTEDAGKVADVFFQTVKDGKIEMNDLAASFSMVSPIAQAAGVSFEEVSAAIAVLTANGLSPSTAIEYLRSALSNIIKPSQQAAGMAEQLGIQFDAAALKSKTLGGVLADMSAATKGNAEQMNRLVGDAGGFVAVSILAKGAAQELKDELIRMKAATGEVDVAVKKMTDSIEISNTKISNAFRALTIEIGTPLLNEFGGIAKAIAAMFNALGASVKDGQLGDLVAYIESLMGDLQKTLETVARNLPAALEKADFSGFTKAIDVVVQAVKNLFGNIDLSTVDGLSRAIELSGAAFLGLSSYVAGVIESFKPLFDMLVKVGGELDGLDSGIFKTAGEMAGFVTQANMLATGLNSLLPAVEALVGLLIVKQAGGLLGAIKAFGPATSAWVTLLIGPVGMAVALTALSYEAFKTTQAIMDLRAANERVTESQKTQKTLTEQTSDALRKFAADTGLTAQSLDEIFTLQKAGIVVWDESSKSYAKAGLAVTAAGEASSKAQDDFRRSEITFQNNAAAADKASEGAKRLADAMNTTSNGVKGVVTVFDAATGKIIGYEQAVTKGGGATKVIVDETKKAGEATQKWNEEIAKMNFQEKLKLIESQTKIVTAGIEAEAKKQVAAFDSISSAIASSSKVLSTLFDNLKDSGSMDWAVIRKIEKQVDVENKFRQDQADMQKKLIEEQIANMKAQTNLMLKGEGLIKIDGAGLKPHLEAFMWEILRAIQVKVNKDGLKMLLGS